MSGENVPSHRTFEPNTDDANSVAELFLIMHTTPSNEERAEVQNRISTYFQEDMIWLVTTASLILNTDGYQLGSYYYAILTIRKAFTPEGNRKMISDVWLDTVSEETRNFVKNAVVRALLFPDYSVAAMGTVAYANLLATERTEMFAFTIEILFNIYIQEDEYPLISRKFVILTLREICSPEIIDDLIDYEETRMFLTSIFEFLREIFMNLQKIELEMAIEVCKDLSALVVIGKPLFEDPQIQNQILDQIIQILSQCTDQKLYIEIHDFLFSLVSNLYEFDSLCEEKIIMLAATGLLECTDPKFVAYTCEFWVLLAKFEVGILKKCNCYYRFYSAHSRYKYKKLNQELTPVTYKELCKKAMNNLNTPILPRLLELLSFVDPDDKEPESNEYLAGDYPPHTYACVCLKYLFQIDPAMVFKYISLFWIDNFQSESWPIQHALALSIYIICQIPMVIFTINNDLVNYKFPEYDDEKIPEIAKFLNHDNVAGTIISFINPQIDNLKLVDSTLYALTAAISNYKLYMNPNILVNFYEQLSFWINHKNSLICLKALNVMNTTIDKMDGATLNEIISGYFDTYLQIVNEIIQRDDAFTDRLYQKAFVLLGKVIEHLPKHMAQVVADKVLKNSLEFIKSTSTELFTDDSDYTFTKQQYQIRIVTKCFEQFGDYLAEYQDIALNSLFTLMNNRYQTEIHEESLYSIIIIIAKIPRKAYLVTNAIFDYVSVVLRWQNCSLMTQTIFALSCLYKSVLTQDANDTSSLTYKNILFDKLGDIFTLIVDTFLEQDAYVTPENLTYTLRALAEIIKASQNKIVDSDRDRLYEVFKKYAYIPFDFHKDPDYKVINNLFASILFGFAALMPLFRSVIDLNDKKALRMLMRDLIISNLKGFTSLPAYTENSCYAFCEFLEEFNKVFGINGNILLNRQSNYVVLLHAFGLGKKHLNQRVAEVWKLVKNA